jgi:alkanesulfonate monooxygenase SsuD/methylene tetrahydromethanopterin reductase-like flavin-dependent oxidoreductase (luciferase family)
MTAAPLGVALTAHWLRLDAVLRLARRADALGYDLVLVDGDAAHARAQPDRPVYDTTALSAAAALGTTRARIGAIHFPLVWNPVLLARSLATVQDLAQGRLVALFGVGAQRSSRRLGLPEPDAAERVARLDEQLDAVRALLAGEVVTRSGRFTALEGASITAPAAPVPIAVSAAGARALEVVRRHADLWDANVPPLRELLLPLRERLGRELPTWCWVFARPFADPASAAADYRAHAPWFGGLDDAQTERAILFGEAQACRAKLERMRQELGLALPIVDLTGLGEADTERALVALAPAAPARIS